MARKCSISGVKGQFGHRVSHANNKTKHTFLPNVQAKRIYLTEEKKFVRVRVSTRMIRTIDKIGFKAALRKYGVTLEQIAC
jgi:large subunit ribosomal protein L28